MAVRTAVIAVAGFGTRFLPATKVFPKELLPIIDKPVVQHLVEEAADSGIENVVLVTRPSAGGMLEHFEPHPALESEVAKKPVILDKLERLNSLREKTNLTFVEQPSELPYGNGSPVLAAKAFLEPGQPFIYMFGDDMVRSDIPCTKQLIDMYEKHSPDAVIAAQSVPPEETSRYGIVKVKPETDPPEMESIIEKPAAGEAPTTLAQFGRFLLPYRIVEILETLDVGMDNELWLADAIDKLCKEARILVDEIEGTWFTTGDPLRFLIASVAFGLNDPEIGPDFERYLKSLTETFK